MYLYARLIAMMTGTDVVTDPARSVNGRRSTGPSSLCRLGLDRGLLPTTSLVALAAPNEAGDGTNCALTYDALPPRVSFWMAYMRRVLEARQALTDAAGCSLQLSSPM